MTTVPNPGSPEARRLGCICATMDNAHGKGYRYVYGATIAEAVARSFGEAHERRAALA